MVGGRWKEDGSGRIRLDAQRAERAPSPVGMLSFRASALLTTKRGVLGGGSFLAGGLAPWPEAVLEKQPL